MSDSRRTWRLRLPTRCERVRAWTRLCLGLWLFSLLLVALLLLVIDYCAYLHPHVNTPPPVFVPAPGQPAPQPPPVGISALEESGPVLVILGLPALLGRMLAEFGLGTETAVILGAIVPGALLYWFGIWWLGALRLAEGEAVPVGAYLLGHPVVCLACWLVLYGI